MKSPALLRILALLALALPMAPVAVAQTGAPQGFALNPIEATYLDQVLDLWEAESGKVQTFRCAFTRLVYDPVFGPGTQLHKQEEEGELSYQQPDKGSFQINTIRAWDAQAQKHVENPNLIGERWVCDGRSIYEYKNEQKLLVERPLPPEMQGKRIVDGPLPFLFGAEAEKLKRRYWMRIDPRSAENQIRLVASPKLQSDAANYRLVELMLDRNRMLPTAMQVHHPDQSRTVYTFELAEAQINSRMTQLWNQVFQSPRTPFGWTRKVEQPPAAQAAQAGGAPPR